MIHLLLFTSLALAPSASYARSLADPSGSSSIVGAVEWTEGALLGTVATMVAVIAVAAVGIAILAGRISWRRGAAVVLGCFVLFGAASIAQGIIDAVRGDNGEQLKSAAVAPPAPPAPAPTKPPTYDPYAGASVFPDRR